jgi:predicted DCC family thiol-disulfide oxidoreductase YuxK
MQVGEQDCLVFYDRDCGFCRRMMRIVLERDRAHRLEPIALQDPRATAELSGLDESERMASWHLKLANGEIASGGAAIAPLVELLGLPRWLASLARRFPKVVDRGYRWVADHRQAFGRLTRRLPDLAP